MKNCTFLVAVTFLVLCIGCNKDEDINGFVSDTDKAFMTQASISNNAEVAAATLAISKATTPQVLAFARHMTGEHTLAQSDLKNLSAVTGFAVKDTVDPAHMLIMSQLSALTGRAFDSAYIHTQVMDHAKTQGVFRTELNSGNSQPVKVYANTYLPHITEHLERADSIVTTLFPR